MPMLALLLLCAGLFGRDADAGDASLRSQILQADVGQAGVPPAHDQTPEPTALQLYRLRQTACCAWATSACLQAASSIRPVQHVSRRSGNAWTGTGGCSA